MAAYERMSVPCGQPASSALLSCGVKPWLLRPLLGGAAEGIAREAKPRPRAGQAQSPRQPGWVSPAGLVGKTSKAVVRANRSAHRAAWCPTPPSSGQPQAAFGCLRLPLMSNVMRPRFVVRRVLCARTPWRSHTRAQRWCPAEVKPLRARSTARWPRAAVRCSQAHVVGGPWYCSGRRISHRCAAAFAVRGQARARGAWSACRGRGFVVGLRITPPSSGQPQAAFGCLRLPLMSNVRRPAAEMNGTPGLSAAGGVRAAYAQGSGSQGQVCSRTRALRRRAFLLCAEAAEAHVGNTNGSGGGTRQEAELCARRCVL